MNKVGGVFLPAPPPPWAPGAADGCQSDVFLVFYNVLGPLKVSIQPPGAPGPLSDPRSILGPNIRKELEVSSYTYIGPQFQAIRILGPNLVPKGQLKQVLRAKTLEKVSLNRP